MHNIPPDEVVVQSAQANQVIYHEMMVHVPLLAHDHPRTVLIIGSSDGGILQEVLKHPSIERAVLLEADSSKAFDNPKTQIVIQDASLFAQECKETFDVILCDSTDPVGPGKVLLTSEFYGHCKKLLNKNGIFVNQNGIPYQKPDFKHVSLYLASGRNGQMTFGWASDRKYRISKSVLEERLSKLKGDLYYYTPEIHKAAFALPNFMRKQIVDSN